MSAIINKTIIILTPSIQSLEGSSDYKVQPKIISIIAQIIKILTIIS